MFEYFLFKPNTAYDLRFIDWISDVCSSDLKGVAGNVVNLPLRPFAGSKEFRQAMETVLLPRLEGFAPELLLISAGFDAHMSDPLAHLQFRDRKSVVYGKSVSVCVDIGGRRILKKKTKTK